MEHVLIRKARTFLIASQNKIAEKRNQISRVDPKGHPVDKQSLPLTDLSRVRLLHSANQIKPAAYDLQGLPW